MENNLSLIYNFFVNHFTMANITATSLLVVLFFGVKNLQLIRKGNKDREDAILFDIVSTNLDAAINVLENSDTGRLNLNVPYLWFVTAEQLSAYHNIAISIVHKPLRKCYCAKLHSYIMRISNILDKINDYRLFFGIDSLPHESYENHTNISVNALLCIEQFIKLFHGAKGDYMFNDDAINKILRPVYYGFTENVDYSDADIERMVDYSDADIERMVDPFKKIHRYIKECRGGG